MVIKVKEPLASEYRFLREDLILFTYLHLAANEELTHALVDSGIVGIAYETVQTADGLLPLLAPMSEVAGRMATQIAAQYLEKPQGGRGILMGGVPGVRPAHVVDPRRRRGRHECRADRRRHGRERDPARHQHRPPALPG